MNKKQTRQIRESYNKFRLLLSKLKINDSSFIITTTGEIISLDGIKGNIFCKKWGKQC